MGNFRDLKIYKETFNFALEIHELTKSFPVEEKYVLSSQIRRSSRAVCSCLGEGYRKRRYPKHFISKISDADMENAETQVWLDFALALNYMSNDKYRELNSKSLKIGRMINYMLTHPAKFYSKKEKI